VSLATRLELARKAFALTARYDGNIATELERLSAANDRPNSASALCCPRGCISLSRAAKNCATARIRTSAPLFTFPRDPAFRARCGAAIARQRAFLQNLVDLESAWCCAGEFQRPAAVIVKNTIIPAAPPNRKRWRKPTRKRWPAILFRVRGVMAFNRPLDAATAEEVAKLFVECIAAPG